MTAPVTLGRMALTLAAALALPVANAPADTTRTSSHDAMRASNGALVPMPEIDDLSCFGMRLALARIDRSGYRGVDPVPSGHPDHEIFAYEDALAIAFFRRCADRAALSARAIPAHP